MRYLAMSGVLLLASCNQLGFEDARSAISRLCSLKQSAIGQILLSPAQRAAGATVCGAIGAGLGNPG